MPALSSSKTPQKFDYSSLDADTSQFVKQRTGEIHTLIKRTAQNIVDIGQKLIEVKARLAYGEFGAWLAAESELSQDTATNFMRVAEKFGGNPKISDFAPSALYLFAAPSTPEPAIEEAFERAAAGETITHKTAVAIKRKHTTPKERSQPEAKQEPSSSSLSPSTPTPTSQSSPRKPEIIAVRPKEQAALSPATGRVSLSSTSKLVNTWWKLGGKHLLYCGDPNSEDFLSRVTGVQLLFAFPPDDDWLPKLPAAVRLLRSDYLLAVQDSAQLNQEVESDLLRYSQTRDMIVSCFLPSQEILLTINSLGRWAVVAEPSQERCLAVIADWKQAGVAAERVG